jgi:hypothetical protein
MVIINLVLVVIVIITFLYHVMFGSKKKEDININDIIEELEFKLQRAEIQAEKGDEEAKNKIPLIKNELKKLREWK